VWSEKYDELVPHIAEYLRKLDDEYDDPKSESWHYVEDDEFKISQFDDEYIPDYHLEMLVDILNMFEAKVIVIVKELH